MGEKIIVLVSDRGDSKHGEISVLDDPRKAEKLVEALLEAGFETERIRVFAGRQSDFQVSQRPVVSLVGDSEEGEAQEGIRGQVAAAEEASPAAEPSPAAEEGEGDGGQESESEKVVPATAETAAPVRFSSLFRSA